MTDVIGPMLNAMAQIAAVGLSPQPSRIVVAAGAEVAWDECCEGMVWTRLQFLQPGEAVNERQKLGSRPAAPCGPYMDAGIGIGALRCASTLGPHGESPAADQLTAEGLQCMADQASLNQMIQSEFISLPYVRRLTLARWDPLGPEGGCVGGEWSIIVSVSAYVS